MEDRRAPGIGVSIALLLLMQASALIVRSFIQISMVAAGYDSLTANHASALVGFIVLGVLTWPVVAPSRPILRRQFRRPISWARMLLASSALGLVIWIAHMLVLLAYSTRGWIADGPYSYPSSPEYYFGCGEPMLLLLAIPVMVLLTPIVEETINRGLILQSLLPHGKVLAITLSATTFTIFHRPEAMPFAFIFGLIAAIQMLHYRTLWAVIVTHGSANLLTEISHHCVDGFWLPGKIAWTVGSPAPLILLSLMACCVGAGWLATYRKAGAGPATDRPDPI